MKTIKTAQLVKTKNSNGFISLPKVGDKNTARKEVVVAVRLIGKAKWGCHLGQFYGLIQQYEIDVTDDPRESEAADLGHEDCPEWLAREE